MERSACDLCSGPLSGPFLRYDHKSFPCRVSICPACGLVKLNPRWSEAKYERFYAKKYDLFYRDPGTAVDRLFEEDLAAKGSKMRARLEGIPFPRDVKMLDVGAGTGFSFSSLPGSPHVSAHAVEASPKCRPFLAAHGVSLVGRDFSSDFGAGYDFVVARHVLEHALDPGRLLAKIHQSLAPRGYLYLAVPDAMSFQEKRATSFFRHIHTYYFNLKTLLLLCASARFFPVRTGSEDELWMVLRKAEDADSIAGTVPEISPVDQRSVVARYVAASRQPWKRRLAGFARRLAHGAI